jgi:hypothetical protein
MRASAYLIRTPDAHVVRAENADQYRAILRELRARFGRGVRLTITAVPRLPSTPREVSRNPDQEPEHQPRPSPEMEDPNP